MDITKYSDKYNELARTLLKKYAADKTDENIVVSPFSILMLLAIIANASNGKTRDEVIRLLGCETAMDEVEKLIRDIQNQITKSGALNSANAAIVRNDMLASIVQSFDTEFKANYDGRIFGSNNIVSDVNAWVAEKTKGMITDAADASMKDVAFFLLNAIAFEAKWKVEYEDIDVINEDFTNFDKTVSRVKMLESTEGTYLENSNFRGFLKPYKDVGFSYMALLPKKEKYILTDEDVASLALSDYRRNDEAVVSVIMPEFTCDTVQNLTTLLKDLGVREAFSDTADFSAFTTEWVALTAACQKAHIEVNREGTKAAAVSFACGDILGCPDFDIEYQDVILNRPFIYAIVHNETGLPVFAGIIRHLQDIPEGEDRLSKEEKYNICYPLYEDICAWLLGDDWDGVVEVGRDTPEYKFYDRTRIAFYKKDIQELRRIAEEVNDYLDRDASPGQKIVNRMMRKRSRTDG